MRIAYLAEPKSSNGFYRARGPLSALALRGHEVRQLPVEGPRTPPSEAVRNLDVLHIHRYSEARAQTLAQAAKAHGAAVVWDNDDDMGAVPKGTPAYRITGGVQWQRRLKEMRQVFRHADLVTAPSQTLAERLRASGAPRTEVIENHIPARLLSAKRQPHDGVTIGWIAGLEHHLDVERLPIRAALQQLLDERNDVHVISIGLRLGLGSDRYRAIPEVPLLTLGDQAAQFDIAIAPLADIDFNRARSNVKLKEYAAGGAAWLASPIGPYAGMGEKQGGRLVLDDRWYEEISRLIDKPRERQKLAKRGQRWASTETLERNAHLWETALTRAIDHARTTAAA